MLLVLLGAWLSKSHYYDMLTNMWSLVRLDFEAIVGGARAVQYRCWAVGFTNLSRQ